MHCSLHVAAARLNRSFRQPRDVSIPLLTRALFVARLQSESQLGGRELEKSSQAYDKQLLSKIPGPNTPTRTSGPGFLSSIGQDASPNPRNAFNRLNGQLKPLSVSTTAADPSGSRWPSIPSSGAMSPGFSGFRSPIFENPPDGFAQRRFGSVSSNSAYDEGQLGVSHSHRGSVDQGVFMDQDIVMEENGMRDLDINDRSPSGSDDYQQGSKAGVKRRASSPPTEPAREPPSANGNDLYHKRSAQMLANRNSPVSRYHANPGSVSSTSSFGQRTGSYASSFGLSVGSIASSATSYTNDRLSPSALSPSAETEFGSASPYAASRSLNHSPHGSLSSTTHQRTHSESGPSFARKKSIDNTSHAQQNRTVQRLKGPHVFVCDCCPKKPKKFESMEDLQAHEAEKQFTCHFCPNRFKNKNEAERHQNSLHLRRHSWSCAALAGPEAAFHPSAHPGNVADVCGYCGDEFSNPPDWRERREHLSIRHKFGECNQAKKFFRADHFRQHLKHSHYGSSGKWTNMLENACMKDEPPPQPIAERTGSLAGSAIGTMNGSSTKPGPIHEVDES
ncbi:hypothetical protein BDY21DRAFT_278509 [Lineolata rhizophorae]|uniref:C2H2-type domain-containing protein n=1 Tax=Lineolata rhizophorae TaxID=578093 RepID=A0A6A6PBT6_9PEZI|nr:hypothetical protein BDY21DRAFT_278509 [Lineolata rhizophorae]